MGDTVDVSVLVPVRDEQALIATTARTILSQRFDGSVELLMIEGRSRDGTRATLERLAGEDERVTVLDNPNGDLASALRIGLAAAKGEFVAKMDAHTYFPETYLQTGVERLRRGDVNWVSGPPVPHGVGRWSRAVALALGTRLGMGGSGKWAASFTGATGSRSNGAGGPAGEEEKQLDTGVFSGIWRRSVLERLGGWQPGWPVNEDSELASRYLAAGEQIVCLRSMGARYVPRNSVRGLARQYWRYGFYRAKTAGRHPDSMRRTHLAPPLLLVSILLGPLLGAPGRRLAGAVLASYLAALASTAAVAGREAQDGERSLMPLVLATMHSSFGAGWLAGCLRFGFPAAAVRKALAP